MIICPEGEQEGRMVFLARAVGNEKLALKADLPVTARR